MAETESAELAALRRPVNARPIRVLISLPPGEPEPGFCLEVPSIPAVDDDFHLTYRTDGTVTTRAYRVKSVVWFVDRSRPDGQDHNLVRVNLQNPVRR